MNTIEIAGELTSAEAYEVLKAEPDAVLVDVRTVPEWQFVGVPDLDPIGKATVFLSWQTYPEMTVHPAFPEALQQQGVSPDQTVLVICRSGARSRAAAMALSAAGWQKAYNVSDGFEGPLDGDGHRGRAAGWKAANLPWAQQ